MLAWCDRHCPGLCQRQDFMHLQANRLSPLAQAVKAHVSRRPVFHFVGTQSRTIRTRVFFWNGGFACNWERGHTAPGCVLGLFGRKQCRKSALGAGRVAGTGSKVTSAVLMGEGNLSQRCAQSEPCLLADGTTRTHEGDTGSGSDLSPA